MLVSQRPTTNVKPSATKLLTICAICDRPMLRHRRFLWAVHQRLAALRGGAR